MLTPVSVVEDRPYRPANLLLHMAVRLAPAEGTETDRFALLPLGPNVNRFIRVPSPGGVAFVPAEDAVKEWINRWFEGCEVLECVPFRLTRNADIELREELAPDLLTGMQELLDERKETACIRLEIGRQASRALTAFLVRTFGLERNDVYPVDGPLELRAFMRLASLDGFESLKDAPWPPQPSPLVDLTESLFPQIAAQSILLHLPYESFDPVVKFVEDAAGDPAVIAIKQVLYRTASGSAIVEALIRAAQSGKHVTVLIELKARFDEARNIGWAESLERAGAQVIYGLRGLKVHAKACLVVRREAAGLRRYVHFGTGNYNEKTARIYSDVSLLTCNEDFGADASALFNAITGYAQPTPYRKLEAAPLGLRDRLLELIQNEAERCQQGQPARIVLKLNSLVDTAMIDALYEASQAGVPVQLNIRGICCLRPGVPGLSENISVVSIIDRYLEHARILYFHNGGEPLMFISSADWMPRNLDRRVELLVPVEDPAAVARLQGILETCLTDSVQGRRLLSDGAWGPIAPASKRKAAHAQEAFFRQAKDAAKAIARQQEVVFEPQRPAKPGT